MPNRQHKFDITTTIYFSLILSIGLVGVATQRTDRRNLDDLPRSVPVELEMVYGNEEIPAAWSHWDWTIKDEIWYVPYKYF